MQKQTLLDKIASTATMAVWKRLLIWIAFLFWRHRLVFRVRHAQSTARPRMIAYAKIARDFWPAMGARTRSGNNLTRRQVISGFQVTKLRGVPFTNASRLSASCRRNSSIAWSLAQATCGVIIRLE